MSELSEPLKVGDYVRFKENPSRSISAVTFDMMSRTVLDGKTGKILALKMIDYNMAYILEVDGLIYPVPVWHWQIESMQYPELPPDIPENGDPLS